MTDKERFVAFLQSIGIKFLEKDSAIEISVPSERDDKIQGYGGMNWWFDEQGSFLYIEFWE